MKEIITYYLIKLNSSENVKFLRIFNVPKNPFFFTAFTLSFFITLEIKTDFFFIPSIIGIFLLWKIHSSLSLEYKIAKTCAMEEMLMNDELKETPEMLKANFPNDPTYVTEEDREFIFKDCLAYKTRLTLIEKIKTFIFVALAYLIVYSIIISVIHSFQGI